MLWIGQFFVHGIGRFPRYILDRPVIPTGLTAVANNGEGEITLDENKDDAKDYSNPCS
jgi:hypothetical protein